MEDEGSTSAEPPSPGAQGLTIDIVDPHERLSAPALRWVRESAVAALAPLGAEGEVRVRVLDDERMADAHLRWSGVPGTTDVLTFDLRESPDGPLDVDLLVCADEADRQAARLGHAPEREILLYVVHGLLHCLGHDDHDEDDARRMHAEEDRLLEAAGVGPVYCPAGAPGAAAPHTSRGAGGCVTPAGPRESET